MKVTSRATAKSLGLTRYFTGKSCVRGHISARITIDGSCRQCRLEAKRVRRAKKPGYRTRAELDALRLSRTRQCTMCQNIYPADQEHFVLVRMKEWSGLSSECRGCRRNRFKDYYYKNRKLQIRRAVDFVRSNAHAKAKKNNRDAVRYMRRSKRFGCPPWADQRKIETIYMIADYLSRKTGIAHEVDHVYPLVHPLCCGLHVPWNLRVIPATQNQAKGNRLPI